MKHADMRPAFDRRLAECGISKANWPLCRFDLFAGKVLVVIKIDDQLFLKASKPSEPWEPTRALLAKHNDQP